MQALAPSLKSCSGRVTPRLPPHQLCQPHAVDLQRESSHGEDRSGHHRIPQSKLGRYLYKSLRTAARQASSCDTCRGNSETAGAIVIIPLRSTILPRIRARGQVAQLVERSPEKAGVGGSTPSLATTFQSTYLETLDLP